MIAGAAVAQVVKEQMERSARVEQVPEPARGVARPRLALAAVLRKAAARLENPVLAR